MSNDDKVTWANVKAWLSSYKEAARSIGQFIGFLLMLAILIHGGIFIGRTCYTAGCKHTATEYELNKAEAYHMPRAFIVITKNKKLVDGARQNAVNAANFAKREQGGRWLVVIRRRTVRPEAASGYVVLSDDQLLVLGLDMAEYLTVYDTEASNAEYKGTE